MVDLPGLTAGAQAGDRGALSELMSRAAPLVYARLCRALHGRHDAEDMTQDVLLAAVAGLPRLREPRAFLPWLRRIVDNVAADHVTRRTGRRLLTQPLPDDVKVRPAAEPDDEPRKQVRAALRRLPPRSRLALELFYYRDLTCREVADFLRISNDAARATLSRSRRAVRKELATMTTAKQTGSHSVLSLVSGEATFPAGPWEHDSATDRLYRALYPAGLLADAAAAAGLSAAEAEAEAELLREMRVIRPDGERRQCTMPLVSETDQELIRLWAEPIADVILGQLDALREEAAALASLVEGERARETVMLFALGLEAAGRPFASLREQLGVANPDRGRFGSCCMAFFSFQGERMGPFGALLGGKGSEHWCDEDGEQFGYHYHPKGTRRPATGRLRTLFEEGSWWPMMRELARHAGEDLTDAVRSGIAERLGLSAANADELWRVLEESRALGRRDGALRVTIPRLPLAPWKDYVARLDRLGGDVNEAVADAAEDLRKRAAVCSFADCFFADAVFAFFSYLQALVKRAVADRERFVCPEEADFSWGTLLVAP
jgi:RNA polymerase sigma-70 factor (ECF subfamily)